MAQLKSIMAALLSGAAALMAPSTASADLGVVVTITLGMFVISSLSL